jgi:hypothetical protein
MQDSILNRRRRLTALLREGAVDSRVLEVIVPGGDPLPDEDQFWDYKESLPVPSRGDAQPAEFNAKLAHVIKDIVSFYNINGGYLVIGVRDKDRTAIGWKGDFDAADVAKRISGYTRANIDVKYRLVEHFGVTYGLVFIPERPPSQEPVQFLKSAPEDEKGRKAFSANDIYLRARDECRRAVTAEDFSALFRRDRPMRDVASARLPYLENNLPARDPALLDFVGRSEQLNELWKWFTERYTAVKLLSGPGGVGKTSIAWIFCDDVSQFPPEGIQKIVWLTAKKKTYAALLGEYVEIAHTHFSDLTSLLKSILGELGVPDKDVEQLETRDELIEATIQAVSVWPCLLVVDDVDSLAAEEQFDVFRSISTIFDRVIASGSSKARALLTARLTLGAAASQLMTVGGMPIDDFEDYVTSTAAAVGAPLATGNNLKNDIRRLHEASSGSPLFAASILRLVALGETLSSAIRQYKGADGQEVRRFAFERELERLTDSQLRLLYAAINLGDSTFQELVEVTQSNRTMVRDDIASLRDYHLMAIAASLDDVARGTSRISVPAVIVAMADIIRQKIADPKRIATACARVRRAVKGHDTAAGRHIREVIGYFKEGDYERAVEAAQLGTKNCPASGDLWCALGRSYLSRAKRGDLKSADVAFRRAKETGCLRRELIQLWISAKRGLSDWIGLIQLVGESEDGKPTGSALIAMAEAYQALGDEQYTAGAWTAAAQHYLRGAQELRVAFNDGRAHGYVEPLRNRKFDLATAYVNSVIHSIAREDDKINVWLAVRRTVDLEVFHRGQILLSVRALREWWSGVQRVGRADQTAATKLLQEARSVDRLARRLRDKAGIWPTIADQLQSEAVFLAERAEAFLRGG